MPSRPPGAITLMTLLNLLMISVSGVLVLWKCDSSDSVGVDLGMKTVGVRRRNRLLG